ncbi:MAG: hypothetical protein VR67_03515 [Peptococcaceae bacterium BRH_c8a]|nr:MAG: hypothetical protein VR67_03515 [Peptococcaceae bacterium BRH_c8a]
MKESPEEKLALYIKSAEKLIPRDGLESVKHYYKHDEFEMAFEGLILELLKTGKYPNNYDYIQWKELAIHYGLNKESVFDGQLWSKFVKWGTARK